MAMAMTQSPSSPPPQPSRKSSISKPILSTPEAIPPTSHLRTTPIHPTISSVKLPADAKSTNTNPITLQPFTESELKQYGFEKLRAEFQQPGGIVTTAEEGGGGVSGVLDLEKLAHAREEAIRELRNRIEEREAKVKEIEREMDKKEKTREVERKVYRKKMKVSGESMVGEEGEEGVGDMALGGGGSGEDREVEAAIEGAREVEMAE